MCRHLAYLGPPVPLRALLTDPPHSLYRQSWAPRLQRHGTVNADGFGIGWYAAGDPVPARYRRSVPIWGDQSLADIARVTRSGAVLAAVRSATEGTARGAAAAAPFAAGNWLFSHNGTLHGWPGSAAAVVSGPPGPDGSGGDGGQPGIAALLSLEAMVDSAFLWTLVLARLHAGTGMADALSATIADVAAAGGSGRFNFLLTDGLSIAATACGDTLWYRHRGPGAPPGLAPGASVTVASEPSDDAPGWTEVPDGHLLTATSDGVRVRRLPGAVPPPSPLTTPAPASTSVPPSLVPSTDSDVSTEGILT